MSAHGEALRVQAEEIKKAIDAENANFNDCTFKHAIVKSPHPLFSENHNILANLGYIVDVAKDAWTTTLISITWKNAVKTE